MKLVHREKTTAINHFNLEKRIPYTQGYKFPCPVTRKRIPSTQGHKFKTVLFNAQSHTTRLFFINVLYFLIYIWLVSLLENLILLHANNKGADQPTHPSCVIGAFIYRFLTKLQIHVARPNFFLYSS